MNTEVRKHEKPTLQGKVCLLASIGRKQLDRASLHHTIAKLWEKRNKPAIALFYQTIKETMGTDMPSYWTVRRIIQKAICLNQASQSMDVEDFFDRRRGSKRPSFDIKMEDVFQSYLKACNCPHLRKRPTSKQVGAYLKFGKWKKKPSDRTIRRLVSKMLSSPEYTNKLKDECSPQNEFKRIYNPQPGQLWELDATILKNAYRDENGKTRNVWLTIVADVCTYCILSAVISIEKPGSRIFALALKKAILPSKQIGKICIPDFLQTDNDPSYVGPEAQMIVSGLGICLHPIPPGTPKLNTCIESINRITKGSIIMRKYKDVPELDVKHPKYALANSIVKNIGNVDSTLEVLRESLEITFIKYNQTPKKWLDGLSPLKYYIQGLGTRAARLPEEGIHYACQYRVKATNQNGFVKILGGVASFKPSKGTFLGKKVLLRLPPEWTTYADVGPRIYAITSKDQGNEEIQLLNADIDPEDNVDVSHCELWRMWKGSPQVCCIGTATMDYEVLDEWPPKYAKDTKQPQTKPTESDPNTNHKKVKHQKLTRRKIK